MSDSNNTTVRAGRRFLGQWGPVLVAVGFVGLFWLTSRPAPPPEGWSSDYGAALAQAVATKRHVVVAFHSNGCRPCSAMDRSVLPLQVVRDALEAFVPVRVDAGQERELANRFRVEGTPTYAIVDGSGTVLARCEGYQPVEAFVKFLKRASSPRIGRELAAEAAGPGDP